MSARIVFRADASADIGSGHIVRCLTLADALRRMGALPEFICREQAGHMAAWVQQRGYPVTLLSRDDQELDACRRLLSRASTSWLVVDSYEWSHEWETPLRPAVDRLMVIDDLADRRHDADVLLDQNELDQGADRYAGLVPAHCRRLLGARYALLTPEFAQFRNTMAKHEGIIERILVYFGGADPAHLTLRSLEALQGVNIAVTALAGWQNNDVEAIKDWCARNANCEFSMPVKNMAALMANHDLIIGAGGTTTWERCALGKAAAVITVAANQDALTAYLASRGALLWLGRKETFSPQGLRRAVDALTANPFMVRRMAEAAYQITDGAGATRVATEMLRPKLSLRSAASADRDLLYGWRNDIRTRKFFFNSDEVSKESHRQWFSDTIDDPRRLLLIGEAGDKPVGAIRYDIAGDSADVSIYLDPGLHGQGWGTAMLLAGNAFLFDHKPEVREARAKILEENKASKGAFRAAGYRPVHEEYVCALRNSPTIGEAATP